MPDLTFYPGFLYPVLYGLGTGLHSVREVYELLVQVCSFRIGVLGLYRPLDMGGGSGIVALGFLHM